MASDFRTDKSEELLLDALRCAIHGCCVSWGADADAKTRGAVAKLAVSHAVLPLLVQALWSENPSAEETEKNTLLSTARRMTLTQAARTGSFLLLLKELSGKGLHPLVIKGLVCRDLYPEPEQRSSSDEDLLIDPEDFPRYHGAMLSCGLQLLKDYPSLEKEDEVTYVDPARDLYVELHKRPFSSDSEVFAPCNELFSKAMERRVPLEIYGCQVDTFHPSDHLLYLLCHAYKHILYGGVGIRQICDICLFAKRYSEEIDWSWLRLVCNDLGMDVLSAAFFRIGERYLDLRAPDAFADLDPDVLPLLCDCLRGGLYGADDPERLHSSRITLDAASANLQHRHTRGWLAAAFPPGSSLLDTYPYLRKKPWLLPLAWCQRVCRYLFRRKSSPSRAMRIGRERVALLKQYRVIS